MKKYVIPSLGFIFGASATIASWFAFIRPALETQDTFKIMICASKSSCDEPAVLSYKSDVFQIVDLTSGLSSNVRVPEASDKSDFLDYSCRVLDNKEFLVGAKGFGSFSIEDAGKGLLVISSSNRGAGHLPIQVSVEYTNSPLIDTHIVGSKTCVVP
ncbi:MAG: hypothetical protein AAGJ37_00420 [Pseudomonadota bacterium]